MDVLDSGGRLTDPAEDVVADALASLETPAEAMLDEATRRLPELETRYGHLDGSELLRPLIEEEFRGRIALVSSFGTEAAVLLGLVAAIDPAVPVLFIDTGKLFGETLRYRDSLTKLLGLKDVRTITPLAERVARLDPEGMLWHSDPDRCCALRKVEPMHRALAGFGAWISGRKRYQAASRAAIPVLEAADGQIKINPLARWTREQIETTARSWGLPPHPLEADGFLSIGCMPCTDRVAPGADPRAGRWAGRDKDECGIHTMTRAQLSGSFDSAGL
jgi:phosphoadenosine phosphosulfate reductase